MDAFLANAARILNTATAAVHPDDWTILVHQDGGLHLIAGSDWSLDSLLAHHGAQATYRVSSRAGLVRVEGRSHAQNCRLESATARAFSRQMLPSRPGYFLAGLPG